MEVVENEKMVRFTIEPKYTNGEAYSRLVPYAAIRDICIDDFIVEQIENEYDENNPPEIPLMPGYQKFSKTFTVAQNVDRAFDFVIRHQNDPMKPIPIPMPKKDLSAYVSKEDVECMNHPFAELLEMALFANYLFGGNKTDYYTLCAAACHVIIENTDKDAIQAELGIQDEKLSEEAQIAKEVATYAAHEWILADPVPPPAEKAPENVNNVQTEEEGDDDDDVAIEEERVTGNEQD